MLLTASWLLSPSLLCKLFSHCSDVIRLKPAATTNVAHSQVVGFPGKLVHVPPCANTGLQAEGEFWKVNEALLASVRSVECKGLAHEVGLEVGCVKASFHLFQALKRDEGVEMAVDSNNVSACLGHPDPTLGSGHAELPQGPPQQTPGSMDLP